MTSPSDLDEDRTQRSQAGLSATGDTVPRSRVAGNTIIVPFEDMDDDGPEPLRVARLSPEPVPAVSPEEPTVVRNELPAPADRRLPVATSLWNLLATVPRWAWFVAAAALVVFGSFGFLLVGVAVAAYFYFS